MQPLPLRLPSKLKESGCTEEIEWERHYANFKYQIAEDLFKARLPEILQWVLRFFVAVSAGGTNAEMVSDLGGSMFAMQHQLQQMANLIFGEMGAVMQLAERFAFLFSKVSRVAELQEVMDQLDADQPAGSTIGDELLTPLPYIDGFGRNANRPWKEVVVPHPDAGGGAYLPLAMPKERLTQERGSGSEIRLSDVALVTPKGEAVATGIDCVVTKETGRLMVTGRNATGKTSLVRNPFACFWQLLCLKHLLRQVRVVSGLWPLHRGTISVPKPEQASVPGLKDVFVVPQRIHMCLGTLADQITCAQRPPARPSSGLY